MDAKGGLLEAFKEGYEQDKLFMKIVTQPDHYPKFQLRDGLLYSNNAQGVEVLMVPRTLYGKRSIPEVLIDEAHRVLGHLGASKTLKYICQEFWWPMMVKDVQTFCASCGTCQTTKTDNQRPQGLLHPLSIPHRPWGSIGMDFLGPLPESDSYDYCLVVICWLTSMVHLLPISKRIKASEVAYLYLTQIVCLHGMPDSIVSDRDPKFTSAFWQELQRLLGTKLRMSTVFHPQMDGATEPTIRIVSQILRAEVQPDQKNWREAADGGVRNELLHQRFYGVCPV
jgi:hypothetical protein